jgi:uncharacterized membrane protein YhaH (DUF805 family)
MPTIETEHRGESANRRHPMNFIALFTTFSGRIPRSSYWLGLVSIVLIFGLGRYLLKRHVGADTPSPDDLLVMLWSLFAMVPLTALIVKRFHDRDRPSWIGYTVGAVTALFIPASYFGYFVDVARFTPVEHIVFWSALPLSLFAFVENGFLRGTRGPNRYGPEPSTPFSPNSTPYPNVNA